MIMSPEAPALGIEEEDFHSSHYPTLSLKTNWSDIYLRSHFFQNSGTSSIRAVTISSRPIHMQKKSSIFPAG